MCRTKLGIAFGLALLTTSFALPPRAMAGDVVVEIWYRWWRKPDATEWYYSDVAGVVRTGGRIWRETKKRALWNKYDAEYVHADQSISIRSYRSLSEALDPIKELKDGAYKKFIDEQTRLGLPRNDELIKQLHREYTALDEAYRIIFKLVGTNLANALAMRGGETMKEVASDNDKPTSSRYRWHGNEWWYWMSNRWVVWRNNRWSDVK